jgi:UDP-N-acetylmuramyl pentapeptide synthase
MGEAPLATVGEIAERVGGRVEGDGSVRVTGATHDSRRVRPGDLFAAIPGFERDGHAFVAEAVVGGAVAVLVERPGPYPVPAIVVSDVRVAPWWESPGPTERRPHRF